MKKALQALLTPFIILFSLNVSFSQITTINLTVDNFPSPFLSEWGERANTAIFTVLNTDPAKIGSEYIIKVNMYKNNSLVLKTTDNVEVREFINGVQTYFAEDIVPASALEVVDQSFGQDLQRTGMLPAGQYEFCVGILDLNGDPIVNEIAVCQPMTITQYTLPELISPTHEEQVQSSLVPPIIFRWTPLVPPPPPLDGVKYQIQVMRVEPSSPSFPSGQSSSQAFLTNYPIIDETVIGNQLIWPTDLDAPDDSTKYVWSVKPISLAENQYFRQGINGFMPTHDFTIIPLTQEAYEDSIVDCDCMDTTNLSIPKLTISQPEPSLYPRKLRLNNVTEIKNYIENNDSNFVSSQHFMEITINWDDDHNAESVTNNGPYIHEYSVSHEIPEEICIDIKTRPKPGYNGGQCNATLCAKVDSTLLELNIAESIDTNAVVQDTLYAGKNGEFEVLVVEMVANGSKFTGKGTVYVEWLRSRIAVEFENIEIDADRKLVKGAIIAEHYDAPAPVYPVEWLKEALANSPGVINIADNAIEWGNNQANDVISWANSSSGEVVTWVNETAETSIDAPVIDETDPIPTDPLTTYTEASRVPLGVNFQNRDTSGVGTQLAITEMVFTHDKAALNIVAAVATPPKWGPEQRIGFTGKTVYFHPDRLSSGPERLELVEDFSVGSTDSVSTYYKFISPTTSPDHGCYIEWNENGFESFGIEIEALYSRTILTPVPDNQERVVSSFVGTCTRWNDFVLTGNLPECEFDSTGMTLTADLISLDFSDVINADGIVFPENYPVGAETGNLFTGFYAKELTLKLPDAWKSHQNGSATVSVQNMILNRATGLTLYALMTDVKQFPDAGVADMAASIDTIYVNISGSSLVEAGVNGKLALPVSKVDSSGNLLIYNASLNMAQGGDDSLTTFQITVVPDGPLNASLLKGVIDLDETSNIVARIDKNKRTFQSTLNGQFAWDNATLGPVNNVNMELGFQGIELNYNSSADQNDKLQFEPGTWAFASPQKFLSNFPVTIENVGFDATVGTGSELMSGKLKFDAIFNLTEDIGGQTTLGVQFAVEESAGTAGKFEPKYKGGTLDAISIYAHLPAVSIDGSLVLRANDEEYGNGFKGTLNATFKTPQVGINALAEFGNTSYNNQGITYRYWRVEALATFEPGLVFLPGVAFYGFGGGAYSNMKPNLIAATSSEEEHYVFSPQKGVLGFKVKARIGTFPRPDVFNADVGLSGEFNSSGGLHNIAFDGDFYMGAGISERNKAKITGKVEIAYVFPEKHLAMDVAAHIDKEPIKTGRDGATLVIDIKGLENKWYFKFGEPGAPNDVQVFGLNLYEYLMVGNHIPAPDAYTRTFSDGYRSAVKRPIDIELGSGVDDNSKYGQGFAFGVGFKFDENYIIPIIGEEGQGIDLGFGVAAGGEVNASLMKRNGVNCKKSSKPFGINGWRVNGSVGLYAAVHATAYHNSKPYPIASLAVGSYLAGAFPNPVYVKGALQGFVKVGNLGQARAHYWDPCVKCSDRNVCDHLNKKGKIKHDDCGFWCSYSVGGPTGGWRCNHMVDRWLIKQEFSKEFEYGTPCAGTAATGLSQEITAGDQAQKLIQYIHPDPASIIFNYPITKPIAVKFGLTPDEAFDVSELQSTGASEVRTFKLERTVTQYVDLLDDGDFVEMPTQGVGLNGKIVKYETNNLGEELYVEKESGITMDENGFLQHSTGAIDMSIMRIPQGTPDLREQTGTMTLGANRACLMELASRSDSPGAYTSTELMQTRSSSSSTYPPPPSSSCNTADAEPTNYDDGGAANYGETLPPEADPVVNDLLLNKTYKIVVVATLKEFKNDSWTTALDNSSNPVTETREKLFRTGPIRIQTLTAGAVNTGLILKDSDPIEEEIAYIEAQLALLDKDSGLVKSEEVEAPVEYKRESNVFNNRTSKVSNKNALTFMRNKELAAESKGAEKGDEKSIDKGNEKVSKKGKNKSKKKSK